MLGIDIVIKNVFFSIIIAAMATYVIVIYVSMVTYIRHIRQERMNIKISKGPFRMYNIAQFLTLAVKYQKLKGAWNMNWN